MTIDAGTVTWLVLGALLLGVLAVVVDRVNFPQKPFRAKRIETGERGAARDRTGAHIVDETPAPAADEAPGQEAPDGGSSP